MSLIPTFGYGNDHLIPTWGYGTVVEREDVGLGGGSSYVPSPPARIKNELVLHVSVGIRFRDVIVKDAHYDLRIVQGVDYTVSGGVLVHDRVLSTGYAVLNVVSSQEKTAHANISYQYLVDVLDLL